MATYGFTLFLSGFCLFGQVSLVGFVTHSHHVLFLCECAASSVCALFRVGARCSDLGTRVLNFGFILGFGHSRSMFLLCECAVSSSLDLAVCCPRVFQLVFFIGCMFLCCHILYEHVAYQYSH